MKRVLGSLIGFLMLSSLAFGNGFQLSVPSKNYPAGDVKGLRLSLLHGETNNVTGLNVPILGLSDVNNFKGVQFGLLFGAARVKGNTEGVSFALANIQEGNTTGVNIGLVNYVNNVNGVNFGFVNYGTGKTLVDLGFVNYAEATTVQIGFVNGTRRLDGVQIGLVNYAENGIYPVLPFVNFRKSL